MYTLYIYYAIFVNKSLQICLNMQPNMHKDAQGGHIGMLEGAQGGHIGMLEGAQGGHIGMLEDAQGGHIGMLTPS